MEKQLLWVEGSDYTSIYAADLNTDELPWTDVECMLQT
jgi:hypothetical protein